MFEAKQKYGRSNAQKGSINNTDANPFITVIKELFLSIIYLAIGLFTFGEA